MGGTKKNTNNSNKGGRGLGPAKRKEHAKKALQSRYKNDSEIKRLANIIQETQHQCETLVKEKNKLSEWGTGRAIRRIQADNVRQQAIDKFGMTRFVANTDPEKAEMSHSTTNVDDPSAVDGNSRTVRSNSKQLSPITLHDFRRTAACVGAMTKHAKAYLEYEAGRQRDWKNAFIHILNKQKVAEDKIKLLQLGSHSTSAGVGTGGATNDNNTTSSK